MQNLRNRLFIGGSLMVLALVGTVMNRGSNAGALRAADGGPTVTVGGPLPLPTTATQAGQWNVGITGNPQVSVGNTGAARLRRNWSP